MNHRIAAGAACFASLIAGLSGCGIAPLQDVTEPPAPAVDQPDALAFAEDGSIIAGRPRLDATPAAQLLDDSEPAAWTVVTDSAQVGVHSAPDDVYTRLGVLDPGAVVLATGRRVVAEGVRWMEIHWRQRTGWVMEAVLARYTR